MASRHLLKRNIELNAKHYLVGFNFSYRTDILLYSRGLLQNNTISKFPKANANRHPIYIIENM